MGTTLTGTTPQDTYDSLIKVTDNGPLSGTAKYLSDGLGNDSALALSTGFVGIGTTSAVGSRMELAIGGNASGSAIQLGRGGANKATIQLDSGDVLYIENNGAFPISFVTNAAERMRITSAGNVGIGTSTPNVRTEIAASVNGNPVTSGSTQTNGALRVRGSATNVLDIGQQSASPYGMWLQVADSTSLGSNYPLLLNPNGGNVGIGTSAPAQLLHLSTTLGGSTGVGTAIQIESGGAGGDQAFIGVNKGAGNGLEISVENRDIIFNTGATTPFGGTERMRITSAGNVGIGRTPYEASGFRSLDIDGSNGSLFLLRTSGTTNLSIGTSSGNPTIKAEAGKSLSFYTDATQVANITPNGITFGADTAAANALDDYEEGTWTMGVSFNGASVGVTTSSNTGGYTLIGRQVTVTGYLVLTSKGSSTGNARITGLPFTIAGAASNYSAPTLYLENTSFANAFQGFGVNGSTTIATYETTEAGVVTVLDDTNFSDNSAIIVSFTYFV